MDSAKIATRQYESLLSVGFGVSYIRDFTVSLISYSSALSSRLYHLIRKSAPSTTNYLIIDSQSVIHYLEIFRKQGLNAIF